MTSSPGLRPVAFASRADAAVRARTDRIDGRAVMRIDIAGGRSHGAIGLRGAETAANAIRTATALGVPIVLVIDSGGADVHEGVSALHGWGTIARATANASGVVPTIVVVTGACVSGPALLLGIVDFVVMTSNAFAYVSGPDEVASFTGVQCTRVELGGADVHATVSGVTSLVIDDDEVDDTIAMLIGYLPSNALTDPIPVPTADPSDRRVPELSEIVPESMTAGYDVRDVIAAFVDDQGFLELRRDHAANLVTGFARVEGRTIGIVANQPCRRAGTLDIEASRKAARFVRWCDAFNVGVVTLVDTPGFEPGRDLEWRGMIRHGAQLVHAYCEATVPRVCVVLRKAYGGAYIVMDSRGIGNDLCVAWPGAEIAVMGTDGAVQILGNKGLTAAEYETRFLNPWQAAARGFVDEVIAPADTRAVVADALESLHMKRIVVAPRRHENMPL